MNGDVGAVEDVLVRHFHLFCGSGGGALGFQRGHARVGSLRARMQCIGGVDADPSAIRDFTRLVGVTGTVLDSDSRWREHIGNSVPPPAAAAVASVMAKTLLLARAGVRFTLEATPVWVRPLAVGLSVETAT